MNLTPQSTKPQQRLIQIHIIKKKTQNYIDRQVDNNKVKQLLTKRLRPYLIVLF